MIQMRLLLAFVVIIILLIIIGERNMRAIYCNNNQLHVYKAIPTAGCCKSWQHLADVNYSGHFSSSLAVVVFIIECHINGRI